MRPDKCAGALSLDSKIWFPLSMMPDAPSKPRLLRLGWESNELTGYDNTFIASGSHFTMAPLSMLRLLSNAAPAAR